MTGLSESSEYSVRIRRWKAALATQGDWVSGRSRMTVAELAWVAGLIEGEGCFFVTERKTEKYGPYRYARVTVCMTDRDILELLQAVTGVGIIEKMRERKNPGTSLSRSGSSAGMKRQSSCCTPSTRS